MKKGFTLIELLIVMAIISALLGIATPVGINALSKAKATQVSANLRNISQALLAAFLTYDSNYFSSIDNNSNIDENDKAKLRVRKLYQDGFIDKDLSDKGYEIRLSNDEKFYRVYYVSKDVQPLMVQSVNLSFKIDNIGIYLEVPKP